jgi:hypothetical protein
MHANIAPQTGGERRHRHRLPDQPAHRCLRTGPHCAQLVLRTVRGEIRPTSALEMPPLLVNILCQGTATRPMKDLLREADAQAPRPGVLSVSVVEGYPMPMWPRWACPSSRSPTTTRRWRDEVASTLALAAWNLREALNQAPRHRRGADARRRPPRRGRWCCSMSATTSAAAARATPRTSCMRRGGWAWPTCCRRVRPAGGGAMPGGRRRRPHRPAVGGKSDGMHGAPFPVRPPSPH